MLDVLADDQALSLRAVAREIGIAATSVCLHFTDRDALVPVMLEQCRSGVMRAMEAAEAAVADPAGALRARTLRMDAEAPRALQGALREPPHKRVETRFERDFKESRVTAVRRCVVAGLVPCRDCLRPDDGGALEAVDADRRLQCVVASVGEQRDRFLTGLVGLPPRGHRGAYAAAAPLRAATGAPRRGVTLDGTTYPRYTRRD